MYTGVILWPRQPERAVCVFIHVNEMESRDTEHMCAWPVRVSSFMVSLVWLDLSLELERSSCYDIWGAPSTSILE